MLTFKKWIACLLCLFFTTLFAGCNALKGTGTPVESHTDVSEYTMPRLESQQSAVETPQTVLDTIAFLENMFASQGYVCEYSGEDKLKINAEGTYYINVNEAEADTDEAFYALRLFTEAADNADADAEGTIDRYFVQKSTGSLFLLNSDNGTLEQMTFGAVS